jgi:hypothetical protein
VRHKETNQRKAAQQLGLRLSSRSTRTRGRQELVPLLAELKQLAALFPRPHTSLGYAATGLKPKPKTGNSIFGRLFKNVWVQDARSPEECGVLCRTPQ